MWTHELLADRDVDTQTTDTSNSLLGIYSVQLCPQFQMVRAAINYILMHVSPVMPVEIN
jgi:hypothetical protein